MLTAAASAIVFLIYLTVQGPGGIEQFKSNFSYETLAICEEDLPAQRAKVEQSFKDQGVPFEILSIECGPQPASE